MKELEKDLRARGIPEYVHELAAKYGYDSLKRKAARNPEELELIREVRRKSRPASDQSIHRPAISQEVISIWRER